MLLVRFVFAYLVLFAGVLLIWFGVAPLRAVCGVRFLCAYCCLAVGVVYWFVV